MKKTVLGIFVAAVFLGVTSISFAQDSGIAIIRQGLLGAGSGAIGGAVSGGKSSDLWIGALTGAGVNIIGGSLLDMMTKDNNADTGYRRNRYQQTHYQRTKPVVRQIKVKKNNSEFDRGYKEGFEDGYLTGYKEAVKDLTGQR
ncbi:MAG: hypothetical protein KAI70_01320 [Candidatus Omnitrophica bacterium]|nr:hypothetical protein [Candidatus Omnitrophota bacterium]